LPERNFIKPSYRFSAVMRGLDPRIPIEQAMLRKYFRDGRNKSGHDAPW
jgi:hypothetical protein